MRKEIIEETVNKVFEKVINEYIQSDEAKLHEKLAKTVDDGYVLHASNNDFTDFEEGYIQGGNRGIYGWGFYFTDTPYKIREYGSNIKILDIKPFKILNLQDNCSWIKSKIDEIEDIDVKIYQYEEELANVVNYKTYMSINNEINELKRFKEGFSAFSNVIYVIGRVINKSSNMLDLNRNIERFTNAKEISNFYLSLGFDGFKYENQYVIFNIDKINEHLVKNTERFLNNVLKESSIPKEIIEKQSKAIGPMILKSYGNPISFKLTEEVVNEGLIKTYPPDIAAEYTCNALGLDIGQVKIASLYGNIRISFTIPETENMINLITKSMRLCGYHFVFKEKYPIISGWCELVFEGSHLDNVADFIRQNMRYIYHITPKKNVEKIKKIGLIPVSKNSRFNYPPRIHFTVDLPANVKPFVQDLQSSKIDKEWVYLTIDLNKVKKDVQFFPDTSSDVGIFTRDNIPPEAIVDITAI